jgi:hypothetical protein
VFQRCAERQWPEVRRQLPPRPTRAEPDAAPVGSVTEPLEQRNRIEALRIEDIEQKRRLENGNLLTLADVQETLLPAARALRKLGDQMGVKDMVSGREVQRRINVAIESIGEGIA